MKSFWGRAMAVALLSAGGAAGVTTAAWAGERHGHEKREMHVIFDAGQGERLEIDDLGELELGESRSYTTESGKSALVTRDETGYEVDLEGRKIRIGDETDRHERGLAEPGTKLRTQRIELDGDGAAKSFVIADGPEREVVIFHGGPGPHGDHAEHGFRFEQGTPPPHHLVDGLVEKLERNEKFRSLDDATQELVREAIRESAPDPNWVGLGHPGEAGSMKVIVRERTTQEDDSEEE